MNPNEFNTVQNQTVSSTHKPNKFVHVALIVGLVIVINLFFNYALSFIYKEPVYENYFNKPQVVQSYQTKESCLGAGGQWTEDLATYKDQKTIDGKPVTGFCDPDYTTRLSYESKLKNYELNVFITLMILGILTMVLGIVYKHIVLSPAFTWAGVLSYIIASIRYWSSASSGVRVIILGLALAALIWVAIKKFSDRV